MDDGQHGQAGQSVARIVNIRGDGPVIAQPHLEAEEIVHWEKMS